MMPWAQRKCCTWSDDLNRCICLSRRRVGSVRTLSQAVEEAALPVLDVGHDVAVGDTVAAQAIGDDAPWLVLQPAEQLPEQTLGCGCVPAVLHHYVGAHQAFCVWELVNNQAWFLVKRSPKGMANSALAMIHAFSQRFNTRNSSLMAASSVGTWPHTWTARRSLASKLSMASVV